MPQIFISYRRSDSPDVIGRIYDVLAESFGAENVFRDLDSIPVGTPFPSFLEETLGNTDVVLVVIGPDWLHVRNAEGQRRLDDPDDFVRIEVETALRLGVPVVPVLVSNSRMPGHAELPEPIRGLVLHNGLAVRPDPDFHTDMARLINRLEELLGRIPAHRRNVRTRVQSLEHNRELLQLELDWSQTRERYRRDPKNGCFLAAIAVFYVLCVAVWSVSILRAIGFPLFALLCLFTFMLWCYFAGRYFSYRRHHKDYQSRRQDLMDRLEKGT